uniref:Uncharacterized protein n=1 Tax=Meloidogyne incognita TaxID=6306 RepID=A0A914M039_MELIC
MKNSFGINIFPNWLEGIENDYTNIYPPKVTNLDNWDPSNQTMINFIYQYEAVNEGLNRQDCQELYSKCMDDRGYNQFLPFYFYFKKLGEELQIKLEQYLINPFLTEKDYEGFRIQMFKHYMERDLYINYNVFLPQKRSNITVHMVEYCRKSGFIGKPKNATGSTSGHGGGHSQGTKHGRSHDGYPGNY